MKTTKFVLFVMLMILTMLGCATQSASINSYVDTSIRTEDIETIAFLPIRGARLLTTQTRAINNMLITGFASQNPHIEIITPDKTTTMLGEADLAGKYSEFLESYFLSGVPNIAILREIGDSLDIDAILQGEILDIFQRDGVYGGAKGLTTLTISYSIWSTSEGNLVWEATSQASKGTMTTMESAPAIYDVVLMAHEKILGSLPKLGE